MIFRRDWGVQKVWILFTECEQGYEFALRKILSN